MNKLIATGVVTDADNVKVVASVYVDLTAEGKESAEAGAKYVVMSYKKADADALPKDALVYADIIPARAADKENAGGAEKAKVPGFNGHADVELATPAQVMYSKTKAFIAKNGKAQIFAALRYKF